MTLTESEKRNARMCWRRDHPEAVAAETARKCAETWRRKRIRKQMIEQGLLVKKEKR